MRYLEITSETGAYVSLFIEACAKIPDKNSIFGSYVKFVTSSGTIHLEGKVLTFEVEVGNLLSEAGFTVNKGFSATKRRLSTAHNLIGLFNSLPASAFAGWTTPDATSLPQIPSKYHAKFKVGYSCRSKDM